MNAGVNSVWLITRKWLQYGDRLSALLFYEFVVIDYEYKVFFLNTGRFFKRTTKAYGNLFREQQQFQSGRYVNGRHRYLVTQFHVPFYHDFIIDFRV